MYQPLSSTSSARSPGSPDGSDISPCLRIPSTTWSPFPCGSLNTEAVSPAHTGQRGKGPSRTGGWWRAWRRDVPITLLGRQGVSLSTLLLLSHPIRSLPREPVRKPRVRTGRGQSLTWERRRLLALGHLPRGARGHALSTAPLPASCSEPPHARGDGRHSPSVTALPLGRVPRSTAGPSRKIVSSPPETTLPLFSVWRSRVSCLFSTVGDEGTWRKRPSSHHSGCQP